MKIKTQDLKSRQLDYVVEMIEIARMRAEGEHLKEWWVKSRRTDPTDYSNDWLWSGPILESMLSDGLILQARIHTSRGAAASGKNSFFCYGETPIIAVLKCFVASRLGNEVEIPEDLCNVP